MRLAYLPNNHEGRRLLRRLEYAFKHGLTFDVGTSVTHHMSNVVIWTSIHHRTSRTQGPYGYPAENYLGACNDALTALGVPLGL
jgi:hypothetical protein